MAELCRTYDFFVPNFRFGPVNFGLLSRTCDFFVPNFGLVPANFGFLSKPGMTKPGMTVSFRREVQWPQSRAPVSEVLKFEPPGVENSGPGNLKFQRRANEVRWPKSKVRPPNHKVRPPKHKVHPKKNNAFDKKSLPQLAVNQNKVMRKYKLPRIRFREGTTFPE